MSALSMEPSTAPKFLCFDCNTVSQSCAVATFRKPRHGKNKATIKIFPMLTYLTVLSATMTSHNRMYTFVMYARMHLCFDGGLFSTRVAPLHKRPVNPILRKNNGRWLVIFQSSVWHCAHMDYRHA